MRNYYTVSPEGLTMHRWFDAMSLALEPVAHPARLNDGDWQSCAARTVISPKLSNLTIPSPYQFSDWRDWARSFNNALSTAGN